MGGYNVSITPERWEILKRNAEQGKYPNPVGAGGSAGGPTGKVPAQNNAFNPNPVGGGSGGPTNPGNPNYPTQPVNPNPTPNPYPNNNNPAPNPNAPGNPGGGTGSGYPFNDAFPDVEEWSHIGANRLAATFAQSPYVQAPESEWLGFRQGMWGVPVQGQEFILPDGQKVRLIPPTANNFQVQGMQNLLAGLQQDPMSAQALLGGAQTSLGMMNPYAQQAYGMAAHQGGLGQSMQDMAFNQLSNVNPMLNQAYGGASRLAGGGMWQPGQSPQDHLSYMAQRAGDYGNLQNQNSPQHLDYLAGRAGDYAETQSQKAPEHLDYLAKRTGDYANFQHQNMMPGKVNTEFVLKNPRAQGAMNQALGAGENVQAQNVDPYAEHASSIIARQLNMGPEFIKNQKTIGRGQDVNAMMRQAQGLAFGGSPQTNAAAFRLPDQVNSAPIQQQVARNLGHTMRTGELPQRVLEAQRRQIYEPMLRQTLTGVNKLGGGLGNLGSGLSAELQRKTAQEMADQQAMMGYDAYRGALQQGQSMGSQMFGQGMQNQQLQQQARQALAQNRQQANLFNTGLQQQGILGGLQAFQGLQGQDYGRLQEGAGRQLQAQMARGGLQSQGLQGAQSGLNSQYGLQAGNADRALQAALGGGQLGIQGIGQYGNLIGQEYARQQQNYDRGLQRQMFNVNTMQDAVNRAGQNELAMHQLVQNNIGQAGQNELAMHNLVQNNLGQAGQNELAFQGLAQNQMSNMFNQGLAANQNMFNQGMGAGQLGSQGFNTLGGAAANQQNMMLQAQNPYLNYMNAEAAARQSNQAGLDPFFQQQQNLQNYMQSQAGLGMSIFDPNIARLQARQEAAADRAFSREFGGGPGLGGVAAAGIAGSASQWLPMLAGLFSSIKYKKDIEEIPDFPKEALKIVKDTKLFKYRYLPEKKTKKMHRGLIIEKADPSFSEGDMIHVADTVGILLAAIQELSAEVERLKEEKNNE